MGHLFLESQEHAVKYIITMPSRKKAGQRLCRLPEPVILSATLILAFSVLLSA